MGKSKRDRQWNNLYNEALALTEDGSFSEDDYKTLSKSSNKHRFSGLWGDAGADHNVIAKALSTNNAVLDNAAKKLANKHNKGGLTQFKDSSGQLHTSFKQTTGGRYGFLSRDGINNREPEKYYDAPITGAEDRSWTQHTPKGRSTTKWKELTRTYAHSPAETKKEEPVVSTTEKEPIQPSQDLLDTRKAWDASQGIASPHYDPTKDGIAAAADYANKSSNYYHKKFLPAQILNANLISGEFDHASKEAVADFKGKVPDLASNDIQKLFDFYSKKITA